MTILILLHPSAMIFSYIRGLWIAPKLKLRIISSSAVFAVKYISYNPAKCSSTGLVKNS